MLEPKLPDGPQTHPLIQTSQWLMKPLEFMETNAKRYGDIFTVRIGPLFTPQVFISNPQAIKEIFTTEPQKLDSGEPAGIKLPLLGQQSLLALEGQPHRRQRKLLTPPFHLCFTHKCQKQDSHDFPRYQLRKLVSEESPLTSAPRGSETTKVLWQ